MKDKRELKAKRKAIQEENIRRKQEKKGEATAKEYAFERDDGGNNDDIGDAEANVDEQDDQFTRNEPPKSGFAGKKRTFAQMKAAQGFKGTVKRRSFK